MPKAKASADRSIGKSAKTEPKSAKASAAKPTQARSKTASVKPVGPVLKPSNSEWGMALTMASRPRDELIRNWELALALEIKPTLDTAKLARAFQHVLDHHPRLRCIYKVTDGNVAVRTLPTEAFALDDQDATGLSEPEFMKVLQALADRPWTMSSGPQIALSAFRRPKDKMVLLLRMNHLMVDGWSIEVLLRDMIMLYLGVPGSTVKPPSFDEFIAWEEAFMRSHEGRKQRDFWKRRLARLGPRLKLPYDRPPVSNQISKSARASFRLSKTQMDGMRELSKRSGISIYGFMLAALQILLTHLSGETDLTVLATTARRNNPKFVNTVGMIANLIAFRSSVSRDNTFLQQLARAGRTIGEALANQDCHIKIVGEDLAADRFDHANNFGSGDSSFDQVGLYMLAPNQSGLPDSGLRARFDPSAKFRVGPFEMRGLPLERSDCTRELTLFFNEVGEQMFAFFSYNADLFDAATAASFADKFVRIIDLAAEKPERTAGEIMDAL